MIDDSIRNSFELDYEILNKQINSSKVLFDKLVISPKKGRSKQDDIADVENFIKKLKNDYFNEQTSLFNKCNEQRKQFRVLLIKLMKEKYILGKLIEDDDNTFVLYKFNLHDELRKKIIDMNLDKIRVLNKEWEKTLKKQERARFGSQNIRINMNQIISGCNIGNPMSSSTTMSCSTEVKNAASNSSKVQSSSSSTASNAHGIRKNTKDILVKDTGKEQVSKENSTKDQINKANSMRASFEKQIDLSKKEVSTRVLTTVGNLNISNTAVIATKNLSSKHIKCSYQQEDKNKKLSIATTNLTKLEKQDYMKLLPESSLGVRSTKNRRSNSCGQSDELVKIVKNVIKDTTLIKPSNTQDTSTLTASNTSSIVNSMSNNKANVSYIPSVHNAGVGLHKKKTSLLETLLQNEIKKLSKKTKKSSENENINNTSN